MKNPAAERRSIFGPEEKVPRAFIILHGAAPPSLALELNRPKAPPRKRVLGYSASLRINRPSRRESAWCQFGPGRIDSYTAR
jgi:hypothetical protein